MLVSRTTQKTSEELDRLARGGEILRRVLQEVAAMVHPGITGIELDVEAEKRLRALGAEPSFKGFSSSGDPADAFPFSLCVSVNSAIVHGVPTEMSLKDGDIVGLDLGCRYEGLYTDTAMTVPVGTVSPEARRLIAVTRQALVAAVASVKAGMTTGDIGATVQSIVEPTGFSLVRDLVGHGVGYEVHEEPQVPNVGVRGSGASLPEGAVIAIEPMVIIGRHTVEVASDEWTVVSSDGTLSAHEELTVAVTARGPRMLTKSGPTLWQDEIAKDVDLSSLQKFFGS